jgi:hypothetical protein
MCGASTRNSRPFALYRELTNAITRTEKAEAEIQQMSAEELAAFRAWFAEFDAREWDRQFEKDVKAGKLDVFADSALFVITKPAERRSFDSPRVCCLLNNLAGGICVVLKTH